MGVTATGDLDGKVALISGGTSGVGLRSPRLLARRGAHVVVTGRSAEGGEAALADLRELSEAVSFEQGDTADPDSVVDVVERVRARHEGGIDMLVSAGTPHGIGPTPFAEMSFEQLRDAFDSRLHARISVVSEHAVVE